MKRSVGKRCPERTHDRCARKYPFTEIIDPLKACPRLKESLEVTQLLNLSWG
jgi:hypothetical protein